MGWLSDTLWVADRNLGRLSLIDPSGRFLRSVRFTSVVGQEFHFPDRILPGPRIVSIPFVTALTTNTVDSLPVLIVAEDGSVRDTLAWQALGQVAVSVAVSSDRDVAGDETVFFLHDLDIRGFVAWDHRGRWILTATWRGARDARDGGAELELLKVAVTGDTIAAVRLTLPRRLLSAAEVRAHSREFYTTLPEEARAGVSTVDLVRAFSQQIAVPTEGLVDAMMVGDDGTVWLRRTVRPQGTRIGEQWAAYRFSRGFVGFVELPVQHSLLSVTGELLWTNTVDALGLPLIVGWRLDRDVGLGRTTAASDVLDVRRSVSR